MQAKQNQKKKFLKVDLVNSKSNVGKLDIDKLKLI